MISKNQIGFGLLAILNKKFSIVDISRWAENIYSNHCRELSPEVEDILMTFSVMDHGPEFEYTKEQLELIAKMLINEENDRVTKINFMNSNNQSQYFCRICGLKQIDPPWGLDNKTPSFDICPCCEVEFGYEDCNLNSIRSYREKGLQSGAKWAESENKPDNWSLENQMRNIPDNYL